MVSLRSLLLLGIPFWTATVPVQAETGTQGMAGDRTAPALAQVSTSCPPPILSRLMRHQVAPGETVESIAAKYNLIPATLMGLNPVLRGGKAPTGAEIWIPPYNGIRVELQANQTWRDVAKIYKVRPDVLFEANGCQPAPRVVFVPGVNWSPVNAPGQKPVTAIDRILTTYPLPFKPSRAAILLGYGWGIQPRTGQIGFHSGIDLAAQVGTPVRAVANGTIAFAGNQGAYGKLVVINHAEGLQTRYAQLNSIGVKVGQAVQAGQAIGTVGMTGAPSSRQSHLHFEVRSRSNLGWVAENPETYILKDIQRPNQASR